MGYLENLKNKEFNNISVIDQEKVKEDFSRDVPLPKPMSESVKVDFLAQANIKVPVQEKKPMKSLLHNIMIYSVRTKTIWDVLIILSTKFKQKPRTQLTGNSFQSQKLTGTFWWSKFKSG